MILANTYKLKFDLPLPQVNIAQIANAIAVILLTNFRFIS